MAELKKNIAVPIRAKKKINKCKILFIMKKVNALVVVEYSAKNEFRKENRLPDTLMKVVAVLLEPPSLTA